MTELSAQKSTEEKTASLYGDIFSWIGDEDFRKKSDDYINRIKIDKGWFAGKVCLDAGCGTGIAACGLSALSGKRVYLFDISDSCLSIARRRLEHRGDFSFIMASATDIPFQDSVFDFINCNGVLHHLRKTEKALSELFRVLKPGGTVFIGVYGRGGILNEWKIRFYRVIAKVVPYRFARSLMARRHNYEFLDNLYVPVRKAFYEEQFRMMLLGAGFSNIERVEEGFYRRPKSLKEKLVMGKDGMYLHFLARK